MSGKRLLESDTESSTHPPLIQKKQKRSPDIALFDRICKLADIVLNLIPHMQERIQQDEPQNAAQYLKIVSYWKHACTYGKMAGVLWTDPDITILDQGLPDTNSFRSFNKRFESFGSLQKAKLFALPPPAEFTKNWSQHVSAFRNRLLCLRPPDSRGLPLCTLHDAFRRYLINVRKPFSRTSPFAIAALESATELCSFMGQSFFTTGNDPSVTIAQQSRDYKEDARVLKFDDCVRGILGGFDKSVVLRTTHDLASGIVDGALSERGVHILLREMKADGTGDPYMQVVRSYDLAAKTLRDKDDTATRSFLSQGAPMFLLCVSGPNIMVAGGFCDGDKVIVEPLGDTLVMLQDYTDERCEKLARMLNALAAGIQELKETLNQITLPTKFPSYTPRIYKFCLMHDQSISAHLEFKAKLNATNPNHLLFTASLKTGLPEAIPVFVKLINGQYGTEVHNLLAQHNFAPTLRGFSEPEGAPKAIVMEYLDPSVWMTLSAYSASPTLPDLLNPSDMH